MSLDVRDKELQLFETNKRLRGLSDDELNQPETRRRIETQAEAERTNGRRLTNLVASGEDLIQQAMRNPEFGVGHLEKWAEMLQILKDIAANRMPSVADLLKAAAESPGVVARTRPSTRWPMAGEMRASARSARRSARTRRLPPPPKKNRRPDARRCRIVAAAARPESQAVAAEQPEGPAADAADHAAPRRQEQARRPATPRPQKMDEAIDKQKELLAEF